MREFMILIGELMFISAMQIVLEAILDETDKKKIMKVVNLACIIISYFLLLRYVYNHIIDEIGGFVNFYF
ncbi:MAG: hypothetical protein FWF79_03440 [Defluviitaleaceae bacterium]|nr:hypothetical protein [Defluviitaleaceae bacterium]